MLQSIPREIVSREVFSPSGSCNESESIAPNERTRFVVTALIQAFPCMLLWKYKLRDQGQANLNVSRPATAMATAATERTRIDFLR